MYLRLKKNIIHELSPQGSRAWLNWACRKCIAKMGINISPSSTHGACGMRVSSSWYFPLLVDVAVLGISIPKRSIFCWEDTSWWSSLVEMSCVITPTCKKNHRPKKPICWNVVVTSPRKSSSKQVISLTRNGPCFSCPTCNLISLHRMA